MTRMHHDHERRTWSVTLPNANMTEANSLNIELISTYLQIIIMKLAVANETTPVSVSKISHRFTHLYCVKWYPLTVADCP